MDVKRCVNDLHRSLLRNQPNGQITALDSPASSGSATPAWHRGVWADTRVDVLGQSGKSSCKRLLELVSTFHPPATPRVRGCSASRGCIDPLAVTGDLTGALKNPSQLVQFRSKALPVSRLQPLHCLVVVAESLPGSVGLRGRGQTLG